MSETEGGEAVTTDPRDYMVEPLRDEFALRSTLQRRKIRKPFDVDDITDKAYEAWCASEKEKMSSCR